MTKREYLISALERAGVKKIYGSVKELQHAAGTQYGGVLRASDKPSRARSKKIYAKQGVTTERSIRYKVETLYNVVIADIKEDNAEQILEAFLMNLEKGYVDDNGSWIQITPMEAEWLGEDDNVMKSKVAVQMLVLMEYELYEDTPTVKMPGNADIEEDTNG